MRLWPWSELAELRRDLRGTRLACSASDKKNNRYAARIRKLENTLAKRKAQERRNQESLFAAALRADTEEE